MRAPQIIMIALYAIALVRDGEKHGKPYLKTENIGVTILATGISAALLWWGGFWSQR